MSFLKQIRKEHSRNQRRLALQHKLRGKGKRIKPLSQITISNCIK